MTNLKITCDGERIYLHLDGAEPFLLTADGRGCLIDVLKERLDLASGILDAGGTCTCLLGELEG